MTRENFPNLIIAGAPKCGTSSLFFWLGAHPEVCASKVKETYFLGDKVNRHNTGLNIIEHGLESYQRFFEHYKDEKYRLEATPVYMYHKRPLEVLRGFDPVPKVIFIFRKPADRLYSHWRFNRYRMKNTTATFAEYLERKNIPKGWVRDYKADTRYIEVIKPWITALGKENILVYQMEKMTQDKLGFMQSVAKDLDIDAKFYSDFDFFHRNETVAVKHKKLHRFGLKVEPLVPTWLQERLIPFYLKLNSKKAPSITEEEKKLKEEVNREFVDYNMALAKEFASVDLSLWS